MTVPDSRVRELGEAPLRPGRPFVLYWMVASRRTRDNFALEHAVAHATTLGRPLVVLEALRADHPFASARLHGFVLDGMRDNAAALRDRPVTYFPYVEARAGEGRGLLEALSQHAALIVTDDWPSYFVPRMQATLARRVDVRVEAVDSCGLSPLRASPRGFARAFDFRRFLQRTLPEELGRAPARDPLRGARLPSLRSLPREVTARWPSAGEALSDPSALLASRDVPATPAPVEAPGGARAAERRLATFVRAGLPRYAERRDDPSADGSSGLSPYLHFGHLSPHRVFASVAAAEGWEPELLSATATGAREGGWGMGSGAEAFLDQLVTWRELAFDAATRRDDLATPAAVPEWAQRSLRAHQADPRRWRYDLATLEAAETHDPVWNAAQRQLLEQGTLHGWMRMLWGKKVLEWSATHEEAYEHLVHLNDRWALDGRDPNSYAGIAWCFGRYDRPWGPERPIFGVVRYMSSESALRRRGVRAYVGRQAASLGDGARAGVPRRSP